jgi:hypothetical protein
MRVFVAVLVRFGFYQPDVRLAIDRDVQPGMVPFAFGLAANDRAQRLTDNLEIR